MTTRAVLIRDDVYLFVRDDVVLYSSGDIVTRDRRASMVQNVLSFVPTFQYPDGSLDARADRRHMVYLYRRDLTPLLNEGEKICLSDVYIIIPTCDASIAIPTSTATLSIPDGAHTLEVC